MIMEERINKELKEALKNKESIKVSVLRMLKSDIHNLSIQKKAKLKKEDVIRVIRKQVGQHKDSIEQFTKGKRDDLVEKEKKELTILEAFLPKVMPQEELQKIINDVIKELGASTKKDMGKVIKAVIEKSAGRVDGKTVSQAVSQLLK